MIDDYIVCPYQKTESFSFDTCFSCSKFQMGTGGEKGLSITCRCQKTPRHKNGFTSAALLNGMGMPFHVVVEAENEKGG